ncbi:MAG: response regulator transcription factor [Actinomycetota bacterium]
MARVLVVEDEIRLARLIAQVLGEEGHVVDTAANGRHGLTAALTQSFDVLVLDWMLPELDGVQIVRRLRAAEVGVPVLMLTARDQIEDRVEGLDAGADDYLPKPFSFAELLARIRALARRHADPAMTMDSTISAGGVRLDPVRHVVHRDDERVDLTAKEFALLAALLQRPGQVFTRAVLLEMVWGGTADVYANVVDLYISYLRRKLDCPARRSLIRTVRGVGYAFEPEHR